MSTAQTAGVLTAAGSASVAASYGVTLAIDEGTTEQEPEDKTPKIPPEPEFKTLKLAASDAYPEKTLANKEDNKSNLVDIKLAENNNWWKWAYENKFNKEKEKNKWRIHSAFLNVESGFEVFSDDQINVKKSLNYACHKAYGMKWYHFNSKNHLLKNVKLFCTNSLTGQKLVEPDESKPDTPVFLKDKNTELNNYANKLGKAGSNHELFVAPIGTQEKSNEDWWSWSYKKNFLTKNMDKNEVNLHFRYATSAYSTVPHGETYQRTSLNWACDEAYKKIGSQITEPTLKDSIIALCAEGEDKSNKISFT